MYSVYTCNKVGMWKPVCILHVFTYIIILYTCNTVMCSMLDEWTAPNQHLSCPSHCRDKVSCCNCYARPDWEHNTHSTYPLSLEYLTRRGENIAMDNSARQAIFRSLIHTNGYMNSLPENLCAFSNWTVKIDLTGNNIRSINGMNCMTTLDTLILIQNAIEYVSNNTFIGMKNLRVVNLSQNRISQLDPNTISKSSLHIWIADFSNNKMTTVDVSNVVMERSFCRIDYNHNSISELVNENNFVLDENTEYGNGGYVDLGNNAMTGFPDFPKLGITDLTLLGKVMNYGFDLRGCNLTCDGHMEPYLELAEPFLKKIWLDYFNITCAAPPELKGESIVQMIRDRRLDEFVTNVSCRCGNCEKCICYEQPSKRKTVMNCTAAGMDKMPTSTPHSKNLEILISSNSITHIDGNLNYVGNISKLDLSNNIISSISDSFVSSLRDNITLDLQNNSALTKLPAALKEKYPCNIEFGDLSIKCNCESNWIGEWLRVKSNCNKTDQMSCEMDRAVIPASEFDINSLDCGEKDTSKTLIIILCSLLLMSVFVISIIYYFRYEIYLLRKRYKDNVDHNMKYDAYISLCENNEELVQWFRNTFMESLEKQFYQIYFPPRDAIPGDIKEEEIIEKISCSKHFIIFLSNDYTLDDDDAEDRNSRCSFWNKMEWRLIWNTFKKSSNRKIIIINFDHLKPRQVTLRPLKAFLRINCKVSFANRNHELLKAVKDRLGNPIFLSRNIFGLKNSRPFFQT